MTRSLAVAAAGLSKSYGAVRALERFDLEVPAGEVVGILGPNGAGKTTAMELLSGFDRPDEGTIEVLGLDPVGDHRELMERVGIVLQSCGFDPYLSVAETLRQRRRWYRAPLEVDDVLEQVALESEAGRKVKVLSGGQQRRLDLGLALIGDPELLFLDEPSTGLDPEARRTTWSLIESLRAVGKTIILTTHYLDEAERLSDRIAVIVKGSVRRLGRPSELFGNPQRPTVTFTLSGGIEVDDLPGRVMRDGSLVTYTADCSMARLVHQLGSWALRRGVSLSDLRTVAPTLEDGYLAFVSGGME